MNGTKDGTRTACKVVCDDTITLTHRPVAKEARIVVAGDPNSRHGAGLVISAPCGCPDNECWWTIAAPGGQWVHCDSWDLARQQAAR
jgi:hypothetical protein